MYEKHSSESEIVIKISPKNLERMIYILIIIGLVIFSIVEFNKKVSDCPVVNCSSNKTTAVAVQTIPSTTPTNTNVTTPVQNTTVSTSGKVEFSLADVKLCVINSTEDKGRINTVSISVKNGLSRDFNGKLEIYSALDSNDNDPDLVRYPIKTLSSIKILAGNTLTHVYTVSAGIFNEINKTKNVKVTLIDADITKEVGTSTKQDIKAFGSC